MPDHIFREYDLRGVADRDLTDDLAFRIGFCLASLLAPEHRAPRLVVARDCRLSGERLRNALTAGLVAGGAHVSDVGVGPTPLMYFGVHHFDADGGVMVTGSHNPAEDNGFKIMKNGKASFFGPDIVLLREKVRTAPTDAAAATASGATAGSLHVENIDEAYVDAITSRVELGSHPVSFVVDAGNGAAGPLASRVLARLNQKGVELFCDMDGRFPNHHPDPTVPENLEHLRAEVARTNALVGLAFDGDGDRVGVVDQTGEIIWGDRLLALCARPVLAERPGAAVLGDVKCSQVLFDDVARHGGRPIMFKTGHSLIKTKMKEEKAVLGGEMSGHFFFADRFFGYDDAIYAALRVLEILTRTGKSPGELLSDLPKTHSTPEIRFSCPDAIKFDVVSAVTRALEGQGDLNTIDGARLTQPDGAWGLVRASNTGPVIVLRFEAPSETRLAEIRSLVESVVEREKRSRLPSDYVEPARTH